MKIVPTVYDTHDGDTKYMYQYTHAYKVMVRLIEKKSVLNTFEMLKCKIVLPINHKTK